ncbi:MAG: leucyl aminopeptidase [Acidobacteria bacterium]|nr:leucyl aminopeptidase [Acidobacteriota bacterium]MBU4307724.1 leucyl aminopeptidase [Acidobacteriota bacterium]MCG2810049.1 leucyl aminopeptidase [Candidatus Aminicenantes bacterium]
MKIVKKNNYKPEEHAAVVIPVFQGTTLAAIWQEFPELKFLDRDKKIKGASSEAQVCHSLQQQRLFLLVGAGRRGSLPDARKLACKTMTLLRENRVSKALVYFIPPGPYSHGYLVNLVDYLHLNNYRFDRYKRKKNKAVDRIQLVLKKPAALSNNDLKAREIIQRQVTLARDLVNEIPAKITPDSLVQVFSDSAGKNHLQLAVYRKKELEELGLNGLLAVGASSCCSPALLTLSHIPKSYTRTVALVGKGITFDAGGLNLKPGNSMEEMKSDMAGAAAVLGILNTVAALELPIRVIGFAALAENMPGRRAYKPGDIITYANKKTVEIVNTDAEGRLILADALIMASRQKPDMIIELSTLTGAIITALGDSYAGLFCRNKKLNAGLLQAAENCGELLWQMPLPIEYRESITSKIADLKNANYKGASSIKAGLFLHEFVGNIPFAHLDIAGTAFLSKPNFCLAAEGATGFGVRLLIEYLKNLA